jgi:hypothetical protein
MDFRKSLLKLLRIPEFLYLTSNHKKALDAVMKGIESRQGFISITGEVGTGKITLIYYLLTSPDDKIKQPSLRIKRCCPFFQRTLNCSKVAIDTIAFSGRTVGKKEIFIKPFTVLLLNSMSPHPKLYY